MKTIFYPPEAVRWRFTPLVGPDARDFLHRLTTVDCRNLRAGQGAPGFFLNPLGKIQAQFTLWCLGSEEFAFEYADTAEGAWQTQLLATIDRYTFAEKLTVGVTQPQPSSDVDTAMECIWFLGEMEAQDQLPDFSTHLIEEGIRLSDHGSRDFGLRWVTAWGHSSALRPWIEQLGSEATSLEYLHQLRISQGRPWIETELKLESNPLELGLIDGIAENKGCYPGQEVIERIISLGAPAKRLCRIDFAPTVSPGVSPGGILWSEAETPVEVGELTSFGQNQALGLIRKIYAKPGLRVVAKTANDIPVPGTLRWVAPFSQATESTES